jgi:hypothetical protein
MLAPAEISSLCVSLSHCDDNYVLRGDAGGALEDALCFGEQHRADRGQRDVVFKLKPGTSYTLECDDITTVLLGGSVLGNAGGWY